MIGGGNSGVEAAIDLAGIVAPCHAARIRQQAARRRGAAGQARSLPNVTVITSALTTEVHRRRRARSTASSTRTAPPTSATRVELEGIFVQIGLLPNTDWLKGTLELSPRGEIEIDARGQTSVPGVFAAGDATTVPYKQIIIAMGEGAKASLSRLRPPDPQPGAGAAPASAQLICVSPPERLRSMLSALSTNLNPQTEKSS